MSYGRLDMVVNAANFAMHAHKHQTRKYTGEPYFNHCLEVALLTANAVGCPMMIAAAFLHDVVEDCGVQIKEIHSRFGPEVAEYVAALTDVSKPGDGNRATRKALDREHIAKAGRNAQTIKLADIVSNSRSILKHDPAFAKVYLAEKRLLLGVLKAGHRGLYSMAKEIVEDYYRDYPESD